jgi:hypothetical protein
VRELGTAMDHTVTGGADIGGVAEEFLQCTGQLRHLLPGEVDRCDEAVRVVQQPQLQTAGTGVDHQYVHPPTLPDGTTAPWVR